MKSRVFSALLFLVVITLAACGAREHQVASSDSSPAVERSRGPIVFSFETLEGKPIDSAATRHRATAILFVTTYDLASQVLAQRLEEVVRVHTPRANGVFVVLESAEYEQLARAFRDSLGLTLPMAMADEATLEGIGPFGALPKIPILVVLDREGHEVWRRAGIVTHSEIEKALATGSKHGN